MRGIHLFAFARCPMCFHERSCCNCNHIRQSGDQAVTRGNQSVARGEANGRCKPNSQAAFGKVHEVALREAFQSDGDGLVEEIEESRLASK
jgi:hypothetical protein